MRIIAHLDMDAFFAAIEERDKPRLRGKPVVVGADPEDGKGRGVVSTANYKAREYGIRSAMPITEAWRRSEEARRLGKPPATFVGGNYRHYGEESERVMNIVRRHASLVEQASVDEAYLDLSFAESYEKAERIARTLKTEIKKERRLTGSIGIGENKLIAKIASDRMKPDGLTIVRNEDTEKFLEPLSIRTIPGVGPKTEEFLRKRRVQTIGEAKQFSEEELRGFLGKWGSDLYRKLRGVDDTPVTEEYETKSIGARETFRHDTTDSVVLGDELKRLCMRVFKDFTQSGFSNFRTVTVTVRFADFATKNRSHSLPEPKSDEKTLEFEAMKLFLPFLDARENPKRKAIRLLGVRLEKLS